MREAGKTSYIGRYLHKIEIIQHAHSAPGLPGESDNIKFRKLVVMILAPVEAVKNIKMLFGWGRWRNKERIYSLLVFYLISLGLIPRSLLRKFFVQMSKRFSWQL